METSRFSWNAPVPPQPAGEISISLSTPTPGQRSWRLRVTVTAEAAAVAGFTEGMPYVARAVGGRMLLVRNDIQNAKLFPKPNSIGNFVVLVGTARPVETLHLAEEPFYAGAQPCEACPGWLAVTLPAEATKSPYLKASSSAPAFVPPSIRWKTGDGEWTSPAERLLKWEAARHRKEAHTLTLGECIRELRARGHTVEAIGPRYFKVDGELTLAADLTRRLGKGCILIAA